MLLRIPDSFFTSKKKQIFNDHLMIYNLTIRSRVLARKVKVDIYLPTEYDKREKMHYPTLLLNDGQDAEMLKLQKTLTHSYKSGDEKMIVVAVRANENRLWEYGTAGIPDYEGRGDRALSYSEFIRRLVNYLRNRYHFFTDQSYSSIAGFSLGGLSALDIAWNYDNIFSKVGVFSGSFWWRSKAFEEQNPDADRIMHHIIEHSQRERNLQFWFEAGTKDETSDRNNNGIIDAIDDTLDLIKSLKAKGYSDNDIRYIQIEGGEHNFNTWSEVFPEFLEWCIRN
ncbi:MAG: alpha/beta hydrolase-fold protein [Bacteroidota bacterium]